MVPPGRAGQAQWARPRADVNRGLRRGAWYRVVALTPHEVILDVNHTARAVPRDGVEIVATPPQHWSVVPRPRDAVRVPDDWGDRYALCPACRNRTVIKGRTSGLRCPRCSGVFQIAWGEVERS
jgi:DNA-directed RNA polymerase subunit RPC12/RpoP